MKEKVYSVQSLSKDASDRHLNDLITEPQKNRIKDTMDLLSKG